MSISPTSNLPTLAPGPLPHPFPFSLPLPPTSLIPPSLLARYAPKTSPKSSYHSNYLPQPPSPSHPKYSTPLRKPQKSFHQAPSFRAVDSPPKFRIPDYQGSDARAPLVPPPPEHRFQNEAYDGRYSQTTTISALKRHIKLLEEQNQELSRREGMLREGLEKMESMVSRIAGVMGVDLGGVGDPSNGDRVPKIEQEELKKRRWVRELEPPRLDTPRFTSIVELIQPERYEVRDSVVRLVRAERPLERNMDDMRVFSKHGREELRSAVEETKPQGEWKSSRGRVGGYRRRRNRRNNMMSSLGEESVVFVDDFEDDDEAEEFYGSEFDDERVVVVDDLD